MTSKALAFFLSLAMLAGCGKEDPTQKAAEDALDVAMAERMSRQPFKPIIPDPITPVDIARYGLDRPGCSFREGGKNLLFFGDASDGFLRVGGNLNRFAAKTASAQFPGGARATYVGLSSWLDIVRLPDKIADNDPDSWPARLVLHDAQERVAFMADGIVSCRS
ncbi:MAG TPA: hypothetical protein VJQ77_07070 [Novosphingobium sp.]|nr:hypothetical protein [Novosphingobium sp.]